MAPIPFKKKIVQALTTRFRSVLRVGLLSVIYLLFAYCTSRSLRVEIKILKHRAKKESFKKFNLP